MKDSKAPVGLSLGRRYSARSFRPFLSMTWTTGDARQRREVLPGQRRLDQGCKQGPSSVQGDPRRLGLVNCDQAMDPAVPFGGYKVSGHDREGGLQDMEEYLIVKAVWIKTS